MPWCTFFQKQNLAVGCLFWTGECTHRIVVEAGQVWATHRAVVDLPGIKPNCEVFY